MSSWGISLTQRFLFNAKSNRAQILRVSSGVPDEMDDTWTDNTVFKSLATKPTHAVMDFHPPERAAEKLDKMLPARRRIEDNCFGFARTAGKP